MRLYILLGVLLLVFIGCTSESETEAIVESEVIRTEPVILVEEDYVIISRDVDDNLILRNTSGGYIVVRCEYIVIEISPTSANRHYRYTRWLKTIRFHTDTIIPSYISGDIITISDTSGNPSSIFRISF